ncbi:DUF2796 domain-containing protein [Alcanivorax sp. JB21]|uniref:ZrgA family zinc uptake protein n=1 Tax=Alcanivorax limicola TaxID=2874102 RepID=UPI001CBEF970|nr:DUF2796 domain-containing protein [Alcanivorax limicola]MBZ2189355.1 DUF2796 domain-containing protein [Alcanivorax limicola]
MDLLSGRCRLLMVGVGMTFAGFAAAHDGHSHDGHSHGSHAHDSHSHDKHSHEHSHEHHDHSHGPHVHGQGNLQLVAEGDAVYADLTVPGMDVVGFERAPEDDAGRQAVRDAIALLGNADNVLQLPDAAGCALTEGSAASGLEQGGNGHGDFTAAFVFQCSNPDKLDALKVVLFEHLPQLERVIAEVVSDTGQSQQRLGPRRNAVTIAR